MSPETLIQLVRMQDIGEIIVVLDKTIPLEEADEALQERGGHERGKAVLAGLSVVLPLSRSET
jgi:NADPH:quinone reductase-like Zn-dependent oxidoreductase